jgi:hypothetical protein
MAAMTTDRSNTHLAAAVDQALDIHHELGPRAAASFLTDQGASFALTCRVLLRAHSSIRCIPAM